MTVTTAVTTRVRLPLAGLLVANLVSVVGNQIAAVALPWLVLERTGSAGAAGLVGAAATAPAVVAALLGGALIDRLGRRRVSVASDLLSAVAVAAVPLLDVLTGGLTLLPLLALVALGAVFDGPGLAARQALLPDVARDAGMPLERANSWDNGLEGVASLAGPGLAGVLIAWLGSASTLWVTAGTFLVAVAVIRATVPDRRPAPVAGPRAPYMTEVAEGLRAVWGDRPLRAVVLTGMALVLVFAPIQAVVLPVHLERTGSPGDLGLVLGAMAAGSIAGAVLYGIVGPRLSRRTALVGSVAGVAAGLGLLALLPPVGWLAAAGVAVGLAFGPILPVWNVVLQERAPEHLRGRVIGTATSLVLAATPLGLLGIGPLVDAVGVGPSLAILAGACAATALCAALSPSLRDLDRR